MADPEPGEEKAPEAEAPVVGQEPTGDRRRFGLSLGNPLESEGSAFGWLVVVICAAVTIGVVAKLISPLAAVIWAIILVGAVSVPIFRGLRHQLGSPDDDE